MDDSMASVPETSPTGRRRLVELLKERQEPFLLAVYLLENGCRAERIPPSEAAAMSWTASACRRLHRIAGHGLRKRKKEGPASLVAAFLHWRCPPPKGWNRNRRGDLGSTFESGTSPCSVGSIRGDGAEGGHEREFSEKTKQLSPVSVLELHSEECCLTRSRLRAGEEDRSASAFHFPAETGGLHGSECTKIRRFNRYLHGILNSPASGLMRHTQVSSCWRTTAGEAAEAGRLVAPDGWESEYDHRHLQFTEIGEEIGDAIFDDLAEDFVELLRTQ